MLKNLRRVYAGGTPIARPAPSEWLARSFPDGSSPEHCVATALRPLWFKGFNQRLASRPMPNRFTPVVPAAPSARPPPYRTGILINQKLERAAEKRTIGKTQEIPRGAHPDRHFRTMPKRHRKRRIRFNQFAKRSSGNGIEEKLPCGEKNIVHQQSWRTARMGRRCPIVRTTTYSVAHTDIEAMLTCFQGLRCRRAQRVAQSNCRQCH